MTWVAFGALFAFGFLNSALGPALPGLRAAEGISYVAGAMHQVAFAVGGGLAGLLATRRSLGPGRRATVCGGLVAAALAGLALAYVNVLVVSVPAAFFMSLFGTSALVRVWAVLADLHGARRAVAMTEGEVAVSLSGIVTAAMVGGFAATVLSWRFAFVAGAAMAVVAAAAVGAVGLPVAAAPSTAPAGARTAGREWRPSPALVIVFAIVALEFTLSFWLASFLDEDVGLAPSAAAAMAGGLYAANLVGRLVASRLARSHAAAPLLAGSLALALAGTPVLLVSTTVVVAAVGIGLAGAGVGALFPLTSSLHVAASPRTADSAMGQVLSVAATGQVLGPLAAGVVAQWAGLRPGLLVLPALALLAVAGLAAHRVRTSAP